MTMFSMIMEVSLSAIFLVAVGYFFRLKWLGFMIWVIIAAPIISLAISTWEECFIFSANCVDKAWLLIAVIYLTSYIILAAVALNFLRIKFFSPKITK